MQSITNAGERQVATSKVDYMPLPLLDLVRDAAIAAVQEIRFTSTNEPIQRIELARLLTEPRFSSWYLVINQSLRKELQQEMASQTLTKDGLLTFLQDSSKEISHDLLFESIISPKSNMVLDGGLKNLEGIEFSTPSGTRYRIEQHIGHGGSGDVFQAREIYTGQFSQLGCISPKLALKIEAPLFSSSGLSQLEVPEELRRLSRDIKTPRVLSRESIEAHGGTVDFITMELLDGVSLGKYAQDIFPQEGNSSELFEVLIKTLKQYGELYRLARLQDDQHPNQVIVCPDRESYIVDFAFIAKDQKKALTSAVEGMADIFRAAKLYWDSSHPNEEKLELDLLNKLADKISAGEVEIGELIQVLTEGQKILDSSKSLHHRGLGRIIKDISRKAA